MEEEANPMGKGTKVGSLDLSDSRDVGFLHNQLKDRPKRWRGVSDEFKAEIVAGLQEANNLARNAMTNPGETFAAIGAAVAIGNTVIRIEQINQKDDHHAIDAARGAGEHHTENRIIVLPSPVAKTMGELRSLTNIPSPVADQHPTSGTA